MEQRIGCPECKETDGLVSVYHGWHMRKLVVYTNGDLVESAALLHQEVTDHWVECSFCSWEGQLEDLLPQVS